MSFVRIRRSTRSLAVITASIALSHCGFVSMGRAALGGSASQSSPSSSGASSTSASSASTTRTESNTSASTTNASATNASASNTTATAQPTPRRYAGTLTVVNRSTVALCDVQVIERGGTPSNERRAQGPIAPGAEATVRVTATSVGLLVSACDAPRSLIGAPALGNLASLTASRLVIQDQGGSEPSNDAQLALTIEPMEGSRWVDHALETELRALPPNLLSDHALEQALVRVMVAHAQGHRWSETFEVARLASTDYEVIRGRFSGVPELRKVSALVGARWPDGHCSMQNFTFSQQHNGANFTGPWSHESIGGQYVVPCVALRAMQPAASAARPRR